jgi:hypothetical protein
MNLELGAGQNRREFREDRVGAGFVSASNTRVCLKPLGLGAADNRMSMTSARVSSDRRCACGFDNAIELSRADSVCALLLRFLSDDSKNLQFGNGKPHIISDAE